MFTSGSPWLCEVIDLCQCDNGRIFKFCEVITLTVFLIGNDSKAGFKFAVVSQCFFFRFYDILDENIKWVSNLMHHSVHLKSDSHLSEKLF